MRLCSYIITSDTGLAPNPFWGYCTLAVCTPNHQGCTSEEGDWFVGISSKSHGNKLIYAMQVSEKLGFDKYYHDPRFLKKRPNKNGTWKEQSGDNMYYLKDGQWLQYPTNRHIEKKEIEQDTRYPTVFIAKNFYYFGENTKEIPLEFKDIVRKKQGIRCNYNDGLVKEFLHWLKTKFKSGIHGDPLDKEISNVC